MADTRRQEQKTGSRDRKAAPESSGEDRKPMLEQLLTRLKVYREKNPTTVLYVVVAVIVLLALLSLWKLLLVALILGAAYIYGQYKDNKRWARQLVKRITRIFK